MFHDSRIHMTDVDLHCLIKVKVQSTTCKVLGSLKKMCDNDKKSFGNMLFFFCHSTKHKCTAKQMSRQNFLLGQSIASTL